MAVLREPIVQRDGWVAVPDGPGLGVEIDRDALERFRVR
jgi:D-galactarolactone cycloisomerase